MPKARIYVIYDQFGDFFSKSHLEIAVRGYLEAVEQYRFYKEFYPSRSLGLCDLDFYNKKKQSYNRCKNKRS